MSLRTDYLASLDTYSSWLESTSNPIGFVAIDLANNVLFSDEVSALSGVNITLYYTKTQTNNNFLSANTSYYTQAQTNNNFLSGNTIILYAPSSGDTSGRAGQIAYDLSGNTSIRTNSHWKKITTTDF